MTFIDYDEEPTSYVVLVANGKVKDSDALGPFPTLEAAEEFIATLDLGDAVAYAIGLYPRSL